HGGRGRDLVGRADAAVAVVIGWQLLVGALPDDAPTAELVGDRRLARGVLARIRGVAAVARAGHHQLAEVGLERQGRVLVAEQGDRLAGGPAGQVTVGGD